MIFKKLYRNQTGAALMMAMVMVFAFSILGVLMLQIVGREAKIQKDATFFLENRYLAESAIEEALYNIKAGWQGLNYDTVTGFQTFDWMWGSNIYTYAMPAQPTTWTTIKVDPNDPSSAVYGYYIWRYGVQPSAMRYYYQIGTGTPSYNWPVGGSIPSRIYFDVTLYGTGRVVRSDGKQDFKVSGKYVNARTIKVIATLNVFPDQTPHSRIPVNIITWTDITNPNEVPALP